MMVKEGYKEVRIGPKKELLPISWENSMMDNLIKIKSGYAFKSDDYVDDGVFMVRVTNIDDNGKVTKNDDIKYLPKNYLDKYKKYQVEKDDILLVMVGASTGKIGKVDNDIIPAILNQNMWNLRPKDNGLDKKYFYYSISKEIDRFLSMKIGSARSYIKKKDFKKFEIPLPPQKEQKKIASILSSVDENIEKTDQVIEKTKELKKGLMQQLLTKGIGHDEFKETILGEIPANWEIKQLRDICNKVTDGTHDTPKEVSEGYPFITAKNITNGKLDFKDCGYVSKEDHQKIISRSKPEKGDILFTHIGTIGQVVEVNVEFEFSIKNVALFKPDDNLIISKYFKYSLQGGLVQSFIKRILQGGVQQYLGLSTLRGFNIPIPPLEEQKKIANILSTVDEKIQKEEEYKDKLEELKKGLMQKLLTGEVRVKVAN